MSFMFNPHPYNEKGAVNYPQVSEACVQSLKMGSVSIAEELMRHMTDNTVFLFEGYPSTDFSPIVNMCSSLAKTSGKPLMLVNVADYYKSAKTLEQEFEAYLPTDLKKDPILLFGRRIEGGYYNIFDMDRYQDLLRLIEERTCNVLVYGFGSAFSEELRKAADYICYFDLAPKEAPIRAKTGRMVNIGDKEARPFKRMMRRAYYIDFEIGLELRKQLMNHQLVDFYIDGTDITCYKMLPKAAFLELCAKMAQRPFRNKPVYLEGVWGGQYVKRVRNIGDEMRNIAWVFDFIPMEVSVQAKLGEHIFEMPFYTLLQAEEERLMGKACQEKFGGYFPIRFNYDDTFHSSGNMSIQVHSDSQYNKENFNEFGRQDESYYIVEAAHGAKTYLGFQDEIDPEEFMDQARRSETEHCTIDHDHYVNSVESKPGRQLLIPAGTIHSSGRNQVVLEIGSLTVGSYTYKLYDYLRLDIDGVPRPIHTYHGDRVLAKSRNKSWVLDNLVQAPRVIREGDGWSESIIGEHDLLYFSLRHLEFETEIEDDTNGKFHVLSLVNGEKVRVQSCENPDEYYEQNYLDIILVPASVGRYKIINLGNQPVTVHKTCLKEGFEHDNL